MSGQEAEVASQEDLVKGLVFALESVDPIGLSPLPLSALVAEVEQWAVSGLIADEGVEAGSGAAAG